MNQYRCETCEHRFTPDYWKDGCNRFGKTFVSDDEMRFIFTYGCASHSDFQSERDKMLDELEKRITEEEPVFLFTILGYIKELRRAGEP